MKNIRSTDDRVYKLVSIISTLDVSTLVEYDLNDALKVPNPYDWFASRCVVVPEVEAVVDATQKNDTDNQYWKMFVNKYPQIAEDLMFYKETVEHDGSIKINTHQLHASECTVCLAQLINVYLIMSSLISNASSCS